MRQKDTLVWHLILGLAFGSLMSLLYWLIDLLPPGSRAMLIVFNFFFVLSTFPLEGLLIVKMSLLVVADFLGFAWSWLGWVLNNQIHFYFGNELGALYVISNSFVTLMLVVTFWSVSLTVLRITNGKKDLKM